MDIWFTSDLHHKHKRICEFTKRPVAQENHDEWLVHQVNSVVKPGDTLYSLGDFSFSRKYDEVFNFIQSLNGNKFFVRGNHCDGKVWAQIKKEHTGNSGVMGVDKLKEITIDKQKFVLCHFPLMIWHNSHHGSYHCHGHSHGSLIHPGKAMDVGIDCHKEFRPFHIDEVRQILDNKPILIVDHYSARTT